MVLVFALRRGMGPDLALLTFLIQSHSMCVKVAVSRGNNAGLGRVRISTCPKKRTWALPRSLPVGGRSLRLSLKDFVIPLWFSMRSLVLNYSGLGLLPSQLVSARSAACAPSLRF